MAPWTPHQLSDRNRNGSTQSPARIPDSVVLDQSYIIPTLFPPNASSPSRDRTSRHARSISHPFPSLFSGKKKRSDVNLSATPESIEDDGARSIQVPKVSSKADMKKPAGEGDLTTGKCMTCDSTVRWPRHLKVFRCTVCLTINDLQPLSEAVEVGNGKRPDIASTGGRKDAPISLDTIQTLIDQCINSFVVKYLTLLDDDCNRLKPPRPPPRPSHSPSRSHDISGQQTPPIYLSGRPIPIVNSNEEAASPTLDGNSPSLHGAYSTSSPSRLHMLGSNGRSRNFSSPRLPHARSPSRPEIRPSSSLGPNSAAPTQQQQHTDLAKDVFKPLEDTLKFPHPSRDQATNGSSARIPARQTRENVFPDHVELSQMDEKTLLMGDIAENGAWWSGEVKSSLRPNLKRGDISSETTHTMRSLVSLKSPHIDWQALYVWYDMVIHASRGWRHVVESAAIRHPESSEALNQLSPEAIRGLNQIFFEADIHVQRVLLKATETLLKRPGRILREPSDIRFLLIILTNPLFYPSASSGLHGRGRSDFGAPKPTESVRGELTPGQDPPVQSAAERGGGPGQHSGLLKRVIGLLSNLPNECHHHLVAWFTRISENQFRAIVELVGGFVTYRLLKQQGKKQNTNLDPTAGLIPDVSAPGGGTPAALHAALSFSGRPSKKREKGKAKVVYDDDWQIKAAARVMSLLVSANTSNPHRRPDRKGAAESQYVAQRDKSHGHGQLLATSDFYNTLLDYSDLIADFEAWESKRGKFAFCQYPFFLSIWAKIQIMEHDARRQMEVKAREAFFDSIMTHKQVSQYLSFSIRRECLVEDSLRSVSEIVGAGGEEIKKGLKIEFKGEEGVDAGGLRKEWFLLLVRDLFNPDHGMFTYDEDSHLCYFNPYSFETSDQYFLVGVVLGLAIYNSTILDVALPSFCFRKLLAASPTQPGAGGNGHSRAPMTYSLEDLAQFRPQLAQGLKQLLEYDGDVENTFCRDFVADVDRYGRPTQVPLCPDGDKKPVTSANRKEFVDLYVRYLLDVSVVRQFEPFKRGFFTVCAGNALSLFRPEEIELLIRGSDEPLDVASLRAVAVYDHWNTTKPDEVEQVCWFWETFANATVEKQRKLLSFVTGSDRIPAMGATNLVIKVGCLGEDCGRFPVARTCFNMVGLWRYGNKEKLEGMLWRAVEESEGFGLK